MAQFDLYEATVNVVINSEPTVNVFFFQGLLANANAFDLGFRIDAQWFPDWQNIVSDSIFFDSVRCRNLFNPDDDVIFPLAYSGALLADGMPPHACVYISYATDRASIANGRKMFAGLVEDRQSGGALGASTITEWQTFSDNRVVTPVVGAGGADAYQSVVIERIKYTAPSGKPAYRLPILPTEANFGNIVSGVVAPTVRTQRTRALFTA